jgi:probable HAF family extracellular repeat protein
VNDQGQVVGRSQTASHPAGHGFVWTAAEGMVDLAPLNGYAYSDAFLVNNKGQVVGISYSVNEFSDGRATMWLANGAPAAITTTMAPDSSRWH